MKRPTRPDAYCLPSRINLKPVKYNMKKPFWLLTIGKENVRAFSSKAQAIDYLQKRIAKADYTDGQMYEDLWAINRTVVQARAHFRLKGDFYVSHDGDEFYRKDEVDMLLYLMDTKDARWTYNFLTDHIKARA